MNRVQYIVVAGFIKQDNKVLVVYKHSSSSDKCRSRWELPGGIAKFGLDFESAVKEKIKDYLGIDATVVKLMPKVFSNVSQEAAVTKHFYVLVGECQLASTDIKLNPNKLSEYRWITLEEAESMCRDGKFVEGDMEFIRIGLTK